MRLPRVHCPLGEGEIVVEGEEAHHLARVLRIRVGERFVAFDGTGVEAEAEVLSVGPQVHARVLGTRRPDVEAPRDVTLYLALVKGERFDWAVEKATELGVARIVPLETERTEVRDPGEARRKRWQRLAASAAAQSGRVRVPEVAAPEKLPLALADAPRPAVLLAPGGGAFPAHPSALFIGPEGGFTEAEVEAARASGVQPVGLGPRILRVETAALAALSLVLLRAPG